MTERGIRDQIVLATKFTTPYRSYELGKAETVNYAGNHKKSLRLSVRDSLKKLQTEYIDLLYLHWWVSGNLLRPTWLVNTEHLPCKKRLT